MYTIIIVLKLNASEASRKKLFENVTVASEPRRKIVEKLALFPNSRKVKVRLFIFFPEEDSLFIVIIFKIRIFISKTCQPPPPQESDGRSLMILKLEN